MIRFTCNYLSTQVKSIVLNYRDCSGVPEWYNLETMLFYYFTTLIVLSLFSQVLFLFFVVVVFVFCRCPGDSYWTFYWMRKCVTIKAIMNSLTFYVHLHFTHKANYWHLLSIYIRYWFIVLKINVYFMRAKMSLCSLLCLPGLFFFPSVINNMLWG